MKKNFKFYACIWAILLFVWCAVVLLVPPILPIYTSKYDFTFWITFIFIVIAFIGNLICTYIAFNTEKIEKMFLNLPLIRVSWLALITMLFAGGILMLIPNCPTWIATVVCVIILGLNAIAVTKANWAADIVSDTDERINLKNPFITKMIIETEKINTRAESDEIKAYCKKVYEAVRYSDPVSTESLSLIEEQIEEKINEFSSFVIDNNVEASKILADEIVILVNDRNKQCRALK